MVNMKMESKKKTNHKKINLTKNEKNLFILLGIVIVFWLFNKFIFIPQRNNIKSLQNKKAEYEEEIVKINNILNKKEKIQEDYLSLNREKDIMLLEYFPKLDQSQIIYLLNEILDDCNLKANNINFGEPQTEEIKGLPIKTMEIAIPYEGNYEDLTEFLGKIRTSPRKFLITNLIIDNKDKNTIVGEVVLKIHSLEGIFENEGDIVSIDTVLNIDKQNPFKPFSDYEEIEDDVSGDTSEEGLGEEENQIVNGSLYTKTDEYQRNKVTIESFEDGKIYFIPSNLNVKGNVYRSTKSKEGKYSSRFEYYILAMEEENRAYLDFKERNIEIKYPPNSIGFWVYSYSYSPVTLGLRFLDQMGEKYDVEVSEGVNWLGWNYIETKPPEDISIYPLKIDKLYLELSKGREDFGVILVDCMEAVYPENEYGTNVVNNNYTFYIVKEGDTLESIAKKYYGNSNKKKLIMNSNDLSGNKDLKSGKILVIPN